MDAETGREPTTVGASAMPPVAPRRSRAGLAVAIVAAAAIGFAAGFFARDRSGSEQPPRREPSTPTDAARPAGTTGTASPSSVALAPVVERFHAAKDEVDRMAREIAQKHLAADPLSDEAHLALGHRPFEAEIPEILSFRDHPFLRAVERANRRRWIDDPADALRATNAWAKTLAHAKKLDPETGEPMYRALDGARAALAVKDRPFRDYVHEAVFASPYVIFRSDAERITQDELDRLPPEVREAKWLEMEAKRASFHRALAEKALIFRQLYAEFLRRYGEDCDLKDLATPFGGLPGQPRGVRSYRDGYAMPVWSFAHRSAFVDHHHVVLKDWVSPATWGYFSPWSGLVLYCDDPDDRAFEVEIAVRLGTRQLVDAFRRQRREWGRSELVTPFFDEGFASWMGGVSLARDRTLTFHGISAQHLASLRSLARRSEGANGVPLVPTRQLVSFEGYGEADAWIAEHVPLADRSLLHAQSWALVHFLNEGARRSRETAFARFLGDMLNPPHGELAEGFARRRFAERFDLRSDADWDRLHKAFTHHVFELVAHGANELPPTPAIDDWPGYVTPRSLDPGSPEVTAGEELVPSRK